jgi:site-specific DNA-methyltransferase (adenine-specific)
MGKKWDTTGNFYDWCLQRAKSLHRVIKSGGYVLIFGHPKTNHRMKCAFEDAGFQIVEEIDWVYGTGFPKNQDIGKLFDKKAGAEREIIGENPYASRRPNPMNGSVLMMNETKWDCTKDLNITAPVTELAKQWNGWKTAGLKPAHEPITVFQKPLEGTYINNIEKYNCGGMNIDACRIGFAENDDPRIGKDYKHHAKAGLENGSNKDNLNGELLSLHNMNGRFPANMIFDSSMGEILDSQSGISKSVAGFRNNNNTESLLKKGFEGNSKPIYSGCSDEGGASRYFLKIDAEDFVPFLYCAKPTKKEKGEGNSHVTVKPKELIKWLIKLVTPMGGRTIDITAGSGTHGVACEELNRDENYNLNWLNIEMLNTENEPYCEIAKNRIQDVVDKVSWVSIE